MYKPFCMRRTQRSALLRCGSHLLRPLAGLLVARENVGRSRTRAAATRYPVPVDSCSAGIFSKRANDQHVPRHTDRISKVAEAASVTGL
eukprot:g17196.t1